MKLIAYSTTYPGDEATLPHRIIIRQRSGADPFVVHMECFHKDGLHGGYHHGDYCAELGQALIRFAGRTARAGIGNEKVEKIDYQIGVSVD